MNKCVSANSPSLWDQLPQIPMLLGWQATVGSAENDAVDPNTLADKPASPK